MGDAERRDAALTTPLAPAVEVVDAGQAAAGGDPFAALCADSLADAAVFDAAVAAYLAACQYEHSEVGRMACAAEAPTAPECEVSPLGDLVPPWGPAAIRCEHFDMSATPWGCWPAFVLGKQLVMGPMIAARMTHMGLHETPSVEGVVADLLPAPGAELFVRAQGELSIAFVCVGGPAPRCSDPIDPAVLARLSDPPTGLPASAVVFSRDP